MVGEWWVNGGSWVVGGCESKRRSAGGSAGVNARQEGAREEADDSWDVESEYTGQRQYVPSRIAKVEVANSAYLSKDG